MDFPIGGFHPSTTGAALFQYGRERISRMTHGKKNEECYPTSQKHYRAHPEPQPPPNQG